MNKTKKTKSAGGVVKNSKGEILVVSQRGKSWSLPKGHIDDGEDMISAAKRQDLMDNNYATAFLGKVVAVKIDRPIGSKHPKHGFIYEANYGFVPDTKAPDGEEIDVYVLGVDKHLNEFTGKCIAIIHRLNDNDDKLVVVPENFTEISDKEISKAINFQEKRFKFEIIR